MIPWLMERMSVAGRVVVTILLTLIIMALFVAILAVGDSVRRDLQIQMKELRDDHREIRALMLRNTLKFGEIIQQNTEQAKRNSEVVKKAAETVKQLDEKPDR